jgi:hypothetical protein
MKALVVRDEGILADFREDAKIREGLKALAAKQGIRTPKEEAKEY